MKRKKMEMICLGERETNDANKNYKKKKMKYFSRSVMWSLSNWRLFAAPTQRLWSR